MNTIKEILIGVGAGVVGIIITFAIVMLVGVIKRAIVDTIEKHTNKTFRITYAELFGGKIEKEGCFGTAFVRVCERQYKIVRAKNLEAAMNKFYRKLNSEYYHPPKFAILGVIQEKEVK